MNYYINFRFKELLYDDDYFIGRFEASDSGVFCYFAYNRKEKFFELWDNNKPEEDILPVPVCWLERKLASKGFLNEAEAKISY